MSILRCAFAGSFRVGQRLAREEVQQQDWRSLLRRSRAAEVEGERGDQKVEDFDEDDWKNTSASFDAYIATTKLNRFAGVTSYSLCSTPWALNLESLLLPLDATTPTSPGGSIDLPLERLWDDYLREKEMEEKEKEKEKEKDLEKGSSDLWATYLLKRKEKEEDEKAKEKKVEKEKQMQEEVKMGARMVKVGNTAVPEADWVRAIQLGRMVKAPLFPNKRKRWEVEMKHTKVNLGKKKEREVVEADSDVFSLPGSEIFFAGKVVAQVGEAPLPLEPERIHFLHRLQGKLKVADIRVGQSLEDWFWWVLGVGAGGCVDGYFTTKGGKLLDSTAPAEQLGLRPDQEVVFQGRLRGGREGVLAVGRVRVVGVGIQCRLETGHVVTVSSLLVLPVWGS